MQVLRVLAACAARHIPTSHPYVSAHALRRPAAFGLRLLPVYWAPGVVRGLSAYRVF